jgi:drug/metabolite transporter (DMT)-like permease
MFADALAVLACCASITFHRTTAMKRLNGTTWVSAIFILLWSTAWIAGKFGLSGAGPMTLMFFRFLFAATILLLLALATRSRWPATLRAAMHIAMVGVLMQAFGLGGVYFGMREGVGAGISALLSGLAPVLTALGAAAFLNDRIGPRHWLGLALGLAGTAIVVADHVSLGAAWNGYAVTLAGLLSFVAGTLYQTKFCADMDLRTGMFIQTFAAAVIVLIPALALESLHATWNHTFIASIAWMATINSVVAMTLLMWLLSRGSASQVSALFYLVPPITAFMAFLAFGEALSLGTLAGFSLVVASVYLSARPAPPSPPLLAKAAPVVQGAPRPAGCN